MVIESEHLTKYYGNKVGCRDISITVSNGEIYGFLGPNGAGKSTFVKMLTGLLFPTSGRASILGKPIGNVDARRKVGYLPEIFKYQEWMTGMDLLSFHCSLYRLDRRRVLPRIEEVIQLVKLTGNEKYRIGTYSKGMQQRIGIASALLPDPDVLFLDEPTSALDPIGRKDIREVMLYLKSQGKTIFLNSHLLSEIEMICDSVAIINGGTVVKQGKLDELLESRISLDIHVKNVSAGLLNKLGVAGKNISCTGDRIRMDVESREDIHTIASLIIEEGGRLYELTPHRESLENVFIRLIEGRENT